MGGRGVEQSGRESSESCNLEFQTLTRCDLTISNSSNIATNYHVTDNTNLPMIPLTPEVIAQTNHIDQNLPPYCRMLFMLPQKFAANLNQSLASSSGVSSLESPVSDDESQISQSETPDSLISSTTEEIIDVVSDDDTPSCCSLPPALDISSTGESASRRNSESDESYSTFSDNLSDSLCSTDSLRTTPEDDRKPTKRKLCMDLGNTSPDGQRVKKARTNFSKYQIDSMNKEFLENPYPDCDRVEEMSRDLDIPESKLKIWFQNKRARNKNPVQTVPQVAFPTPMFVPSLPHPMMTNQPTHPAYPTFPFMLPQMYPMPFAPQQIMRHAYYPFPASPMTFQIAPPMMSAFSMVRPSVTNQLTK